MAEGKTASEVEETQTQPSSPVGWSGLLEGVMEDEVEEKELPASISDLINCHWGMTAEGFDENGTIEERYGDVPLRDEPRLSSVRLRREARLRLLEAIGSCQTLRRLRVNVQQFASTAREAQALLSPLKSNPALQEMFIEGQLRDNTRWVMDGLCDVIRWAPKLRILSLDVALRSMNDMKVLTNALVKCSPALENLTVGMTMGFGVWDFLLDVFTGTDSNQSIPVLCVQPLSVDVDGLSRTISLNESLRGISMNADYEWSRNQWRQAGQSMDSNFTLGEFEVVFWKGLPASHFESLRGLLDAANKRANPIIKITVSGRAGLASKSTCLFLVNVLRELNSVKALRLDFYDVQQSHRFELHRIFDVLRVHVCKLQSLELECCKGKGIEGGWKQLFDSLRSNSSLTHLGLRSNLDLCDESFKDLMSLLEVNVTLRTVDYSGTRWEAEGKGPLIDEALKRNAERESYIGVLKEAKLKFHKARAGRLFLCGSPYAGKTRLRRTMMRLSNKGWFGNKLDKLRQNPCAYREVELWRTSGIEVELLQDDEDMQIAIWDLAGQEIFRSLHDIIFPRTDQPYIFLFVFSPYDELKNTIKVNLEALLREELEDWLRFVASNSRMGQSLPRMIVILTHVDKVKSPGIDWVIMILEELQNEYQGVVDLFLDPKIGRLYVNAHKEKHVSPLLKQILSSFKELFSKKSDIVPQLCSELTSILSRADPSIYGDPIWSLDQFYTFCCKSVEALNQLSAEAWQSVALYLHDVGSIVLIPDSDLVVVYPNWLTRTYLGELIKLGHDFQVLKETHHATQQTVYSETGCVDEKILEEWLVESFISRPRDSQYQVETLKLILAKLDLCYRMDESSCAFPRYFIPTIISEGEVQHGRPRAWKSVSDVQPNYFGFRLQCQDPWRTSLTTSFFTRLQITLRKKVIANSSLSADVECSRGYTTLYMDGHEIIMEESQQRTVVGSHVDILVKGSGGKSKDDTVKFVMKHIIDEIRAFCASPRGCQGVILVLGILSTKCVEMLVPCELRDERQVVMVEHLKQQLQQDLEARLEEEDIKDENSLLKYEHVWAEVLEGNLPRYSEFAKDLLWESEVEKLLGMVQCKRKEQLQNLRDVSEQLRSEISESTSRGKSLPSVDIDESGSVGASDSEPVILSRIVPNYSSEKHLHQPNQSALDTLDCNEDKLEEMDNRLLTIQKRLQTSSMKGRLHQIVSIQQRMNSTLATFQSNLDEMVGFSSSLEQARIPKRPYFSKKDTRLLQKITSKVRFGKVVRLHFMCESKTKPHFIQDQGGMELVLEKENCKWLRRLSTISIQTVWFFLKAGLQVTLGLQPAFPAVDDFETQVSAMIGTAVFEKFKVAEALSLTQKNEAWCSLTNLLDSKLQGNYADVFNLHRVKYSSSDDGGYGWLCDLCMKKGIMSGRLEL
ncbi:hypothetical protein Mapa_013630 [Marchantia paleacea]|nr:hypothetical protein Mapa_013630 [Marchantia paleacea]